MAALERDAYEGGEKPFCFSQNYRNAKFFFSSEIHCISSERQKYDVGENNFHLMH